MTTIKKAGIWMDNASAHTFEFTDEVKKVDTVESDFTSQIRGEVLSKGESHMHNKEQNKQAEFYKKISQYILQYDEVLLFGPTNAKSELLNILKEDHRYDKIKIEIKPSEKMTDNQMEAFIKDHFNTSKMDS